VVFSFNDRQAVRTPLRRTLLVGIASGHYSMEDLRQAGADVVLSSLEEPIPGLEWAWAQT
jgi:phosphoglycolate phosphatase-like HAD superfamily hydrolase